MPLIESTTSIDASPETVYRVSQDYGIRMHWDPFPESIAPLPGQDDGLYRVLVRSKHGMQMRVRFVQQRPPERAAIVMEEGPWMLKRFAGSWIFKPDGGAGTLARFRYHFETQPKWLRFVISPLATLYFQRTARLRLSGLKRYCEHEVQGQTQKRSA